MGQNYEVNGIVTDYNSEESLPGVNIVLKGTSNGTTTDLEGGYSLNVPSLQDTLVFSFIGVRTQEVPINGRVEINIKLQPRVISGEEIVVIGYGTEEAENLTGSVGTVEMKTVSNQPLSSANEALSGQIAGVQVNTSNGIPGGGPQIQVRGIAAIGAGNTPLYVVDGFSMPSSDNSQISNPLTNLPPSDIASISVLKGPSATSIYGSRAANGVVVIETKSGRTGTDELEFQIAGYTGVQAIPESAKPNMMNAQEFAAFKNEFIIDKNRVTGSNDPIPEEYQNPSQYGKGTDWYDVVTRVAPTQSVSVSARGGGDDIRSYISGSYLHQDGVVEASNYNRISLRTNVDANITDDVQMALKFSPTYSYGNRSAVGSSGRSGFFGSWETLSPIEPVYNSDGTYNNFITSPGLLGGPNPLLGLKEVTNYENSLNILGNIFVRYNLNNDLDFKTTLNTEWQNVKNRFFQPSTIGGFASPPPTIPSGSYNQNGYLNWAYENQVNYDRTFNKLGRIKLLGVFSIQRHLYQAANFNGQEFPDNQIQTLNAASRITGGTNTQRWGMVSYVGRLNYSYKDKYLLTAAVRRDGSSKFGPDNRWGTFPSIALGWRVTNEPWMSNNSSFLSNLKIRAEYGITGNDQIGTYAYTAGMQSSNYIYNGNSLASGKVVGSLGNSKLSWAKTAELGIGLDIGLFDDYISITADYYRSTTSDLLLNVEVPRLSGFSSSLRNIGEIQNTGVEIGIKSFNVSTSDFSWNSNVNFSLNRNKDLALGPTGSPIIAMPDLEGPMGKILHRLEAQLGYSMVINF